VSIATIAYGAKRIVAEQASYNGPQAPQCVPQTLNRSALLPNTNLSVSPLPDSLDSSPYTQISLLGDPRSALSKVTVVGSHTGKHSGHLLVYSQGDGASFVPSKPFTPGEQVTVTGILRSAAKSAPFAFHFTVSEPDRIPRPTSAPHTPAGVDGSPTEYQVFHSRPELKPPRVDVTTAAPQTTPGYIFTAPYAGPGQDGPMIFDNAGNLVWFDPLPYGTEATNLQEQIYEGQPVLTWWQGYIPPQGFGEGEEVVVNSAYQQIAHIKAGNGYEADLHDFHIYPNNTAVMTVFNPIHCNLSSIGGSRDSAVTDGVFQEIDLKTHLVRREWHSLDHVALSESHSSPLRSTTQWPFDFFHINSIDVHQNGTTLISARNTWGVYELNSQTGQITFSAGAKHGAVQMGAGTPTAYQHDATELPDGEISIFDNGGVPKVHPQSRGILVKVDPQTNNDTLVATYEHPRALSSGSQGNIQMLSDGNVFIGWGAEPYVSEFSATGQLLFDAHMPAAEESYRSYRFAWSGTPSTPPTIVASTTSATSPVTAYVSWNGATNVASWRLLAGPSADSLTTVSTIARTGFETELSTAGPDAYVVAQALNEAGEVLSTSPTIKS
jgi:Arylsulfotransferase (ASST)